MELAVLLGLLGLVLMALAFWGGMEAELARRRHPYPTANSLEDALAVAIDTLWLRQRAARGPPQ